MVAGEDGGTRAVDARPRLALPAREKDRQILEAPERTGGLGEFALPHACIGGRVGARFAKVGERGLESFDGGVKGHSATNPGGGVRVMKWPLTPSGHSDQATRPCSLAA